MSSLPASYKAWQVQKAGDPLSLETFQLTQPGPGEVLVKVLACGVCHSDVGMQKGEFGPVHPRVPGHELVGDVVAVGKGVTKYSGGERVGGAWHGGKSENRVSCEIGIINGVTRNGGYAEFCLLREEAVVQVPVDLDPTEAAPLLCAGVTVFNGIRKMEIAQGSLVAIQGLGGLGHLAVQFAKKMGYKLGTSKKDFAFQLGADHYVDATVDDPVEKLKELGGAALIVATAPNPKAISALTGGLTIRGKLLVLAPVGNIEINSLHLIGGGCSVHGWPSGHALDAEEAIQFSKDHDIKCLIEKFKMEDAPEAVECMMANQVRFRSVLFMP
ncbi:hypothetical protein ACHAP5_011868 [Fusarium lateritium]